MVILSLNYEAFCLKLSHLDRVYSLNDSRENLVIFDCIVTYAFAVFSTIALLIFPKNPPKALLILANLL